MPFMEYIGGGDNRCKAFILALVCQESCFIRSAVSISYTLGVMQFMPFLANDIGKKVLENFIIYSHILDSHAKISVRQELQDLLTPSKSDDSRQVIAFARRNFISLAQGEYRHRAIPCLSYLLGKNAQFYS